MLEINLLPVREARRKADLRQYVMQLVLVLIVVGGGIGIFHSQLTDEIERTEGRIQQMEVAIEQFKPQLEQVAAFKKRKNELQKKIDVIENLDRARTGPVRVMAELASRAPERLWLTNLTTKGKTISLRGQSLDNELVADFLRELGESEYFTEVDLDSTRLEESKGLKLIKFEIHAEMVNPEIQKAEAGAAPAAKPAQPVNG